MKSEKIQLNSMTSHRNPANSYSNPAHSNDQVTESTPSSKIHGAIKIALVTDDPYRAEALTDVTKSAGWQIVHSVGNRNPVAWLENEEADVALIDLDINGAVTCLTQLTATTPSLPLIALATPHHLIELQDALLAGAKAFVPFPVNGQQFVATVLRVANEGELEQSVRPAQNQVIAVTGLKGGVGRSTIAMNLAVAMKERQSSDVILVEAHHGLSDISVMMSLHPSRTLADIASAAQIDTDIVAGSLHTHSSGVKLLTAPTSTEELVDLSIEDWRLLFDELTQLAPTVIVDTSADPNGLLSEVLTIASDIVIVTDPHMTSVNGAHGLMQSLRNENVHTKAHLIINRSGMSGGISAQGIRKRMDLPILVELPDDAPLVTYAINRGLPIVTSHPRSAMSRSFGKLAEHFVAVEGPQADSSENIASGGPLDTLRHKAATLASLL